MTREQIKEFIPHREPMILVDKIEIDENNVAHASYHVTGEEFFLQGHFPGHPVVPGVILCEMMAQACALLIGDDLKGRTPFYAGIEGVRFKNSVFPGDTFETTARLVDKKGMVYFTEAKGTVDGKLCVKSKLAFALVDNDKLEERKQ